MIVENALQDIKILLFSQYFFGYEEKIAKKMRELGAEVSLYDEMSVNTPFERALLKISSSVFKNKTKKYYDDILEKEKSNRYDYVVFIDCEMPTANVLKKYKRNFKEARFCLHMWDSIDNLKGVADKFKFFDHITSFDRKDATVHKLGFRPLFFCDEYRATAEKREYKYNLSFIGTIHSDRYSIIKELKNNTTNFYLYPYLQSKFIYYFFKWTKKEFRYTKITDFRFDKIDSLTIAGVVNESSAILDIQHPMQTGLTMRTLEMLGMNKKIVTTNIDIKNYDFYNPNNICIIDRKKPVVPNEFYNREYEYLDNNIYEYYSIGQWILDVLGVCHG